MSQLSEDAIRLAIASCPHCFGLSPEQVNPMLLFLKRQLELGEAESLTEEWKECFDLVNATLHQKVVEVFASATPKKSNANPRGSRNSGKPASSNPRPDRNRDRPARPAAGNAEADSPLRRELSTRQLRYLGYLHRQLGEEPDYNVISKLSQKEATMRIKELEAKVNER